MWILDSSTGFACGKWRTIRSSAPSRPDLPPCPHFFGGLSLSRKVGRTRSKICWRQSSFMGSSACCTGCAARRAAEALRQARSGAPVVFFGSSAREPPVSLISLPTRIGLRLTCANCSSTQKGKKKIPKNTAHSFSAHRVRHKGRSPSRQVKRTDEPEQNTLLIEEERVIRTQNPRSFH